MEQLMSSTSFSYASSRLDSASQEIRLLQLFCGKEEEPVHCRLSREFLSEKPAYEALSYCWGNAAVKEAITCNGALLEVGKNLHRALIRLREPLTSRMLWIDAICINQGDIQEREEQVPLMRDIYAGSSQVLVWLGEHDTSSRNGFYIVQLMNPLFSPHLIQLKSPKELRDTGFLRRHGLSSHISGKWGDVCKIFQREYFKRMWVIQEVVVARSIVAMCGDVIVPWYKLENAIMFMFYSGVTAAQSYVGMDGIQQMIYLRSETNKRQCPEIMDLLITCRRSRATEAVDKVFALYGLTADPVQGGVGIPVDYQIDAQTLYCKVAAAIIRSRQDLSLLKVLNLSISSVRGLPSWVPDWSQDSEMSYLPLPRRQGQEQQFWTSDEMRYTPSFRMQGRYLGVEGLVVDGIDLVGELLAGTDMTPGTMSSVVTRSATATRIFLSWAGLVLGCSTVGLIFSRYEQNMLEAFAHSLSAGYEDSRSQIERQAFRNWFRVQLLDRCIDLLHLYWVHWSIHLVVRFLLVTLGTLTGLLSLSDPPNYVYARGRRMGKTIKGNVVLAPAGTRVGDKIAIFKGGDLPYIIRPVKANHWELVGEAYVHGLMQCREFDPYRCRNMWLV